MSLNTLQQKAFDLVVNEHKSVCINARAGSGKSYVGNKIIEAIMKQGYRVLSCAFTGAAASLLIDGITAHKASALGIGKSSMLPAGVKRERSKEGKTVNAERSTVSEAALRADDKWMAADLLVVLDEISQFSSEDAHLWYSVGMEKRAKAKVNKPPIFLFLGDFGQFLPIDGNLIFEKAVFSYYCPEAKDNITITRPSIMDEIKPEIINLTEIMRQSDPKFIKALRWLHEGIAIHPSILKRLEEPVPPNCPNYYFNNILVNQENYTRLAPFKQNQSRTYFSIGESLSEQELKYLLPVAPEMTLYVGCPFTITINVYDSKGEMVVANGEVVTVQHLKERAIRAVKADGTIVELGYVNHYLPFTSKDGKSKKTFLFLPGYPGDSCSIMKVQGKTYSTPICFAVWQFMSSRASYYPLSMSGALYTICSRVTSLDNLYFDTSLDLDVTKSLIKSSLHLDPKVRKFLNKGKEPLWMTDKNKERYVIEAKSFKELSIQSKYARAYLVEYEFTNLTNGQELSVVCCIGQSSSKEFELVAYGEKDNSTGVVVQSEPKYPYSYEELAKRLILQN
jgi:hypothetical protein